MKKCSLIFSFVLAIFTLPSVASAQAPPMDMSWAFRSQQYLWNQGQATAAYYGQLCYQYSVMLRARGYMGPIDCGANAATLQQSIARLQNSYYNYNQAQMYNSWRRGIATDRANRAITGQYVPPYNCYYYYNGYGYRVC